MHTAARQRLAQTREEGVDAAVHVEWGREVEDPRDLSGGEIILEPQSKQQPVGRIEAGEAGGQRARQFSRAKLRLRIAARVAMQLIDVERFAHMVDEPPSRGVRLARAFSVILQAPVSLALMIEAEAPGDHHEPRGELGTSIVGVHAQTATVIGAEMLEQVRVAIHRGVVVARHTASRVKQQAAVGLDERAPRRIARRRTRGGEERGQLGWKHRGSTPLERLALT
jgi:hypothetical protein